MLSSLLKARRAGQAQVLRFASSWQHETIQENDDQASLGTRPFHVSTIRKGSDDGGSETGRAVLEFWRKLLASGTTQHQQHQLTGRHVDESKVKELLQTAVRLRQGRPQSTLPEEAVEVLMQVYRCLDLEGRQALLHQLTAHFGVDASLVSTAVAAWQQHPSSVPAEQHGPSSTGSASGGGSSTYKDHHWQQQEQLWRAAQRLGDAAQPLFAHLFVPISQQPGGIKFLADMRADLLTCIAAQPARAGPLRALSEALRRRLAEWFSVGLLQLERLTWEGSSAGLLEKVVAGEAVHAYSGWEDLKARLDPGSRRAFAFFHPAMPGEPLVVLHTALGNKIAESMADILPEHAAMAEKAADHHGCMRSWQQGPRSGSPSLSSSSGESSTAPSGPSLGSSSTQGPPTVACFYSISAYQRGLQGVDLGNFLIKQVAHRLLAELPSLQTLVTLSPMPGFAAWLDLQIALHQRRQPQPLPLLLPGEIEALAAVAAGHVSFPGEEGLATGSTGSSSDADSSPTTTSSSGGSTREQEQQARGAALLRWALQDDHWLGHAGLQAALRPLLLRLGARYLLRERRRKLTLDAVANFHLRNGASVRALRWRADLSPAGLARSHGLMVNYQYKLETVPENNRRYIVDQMIVAAPEVEALLHSAPAAADS